MSSDQWIRVEEKLPENDDFVLVYNSNLPESGVGIGRLFFGKWNEPFDYGTGPGDITVTHWQPFPGPPTR